MTETQRAAIEAHGRNLLAIFPNAAECDPVKLCRKLRRLELEAGEFALRCCNGPEWPSEDAQDADAEKIGRKVDALLGRKADDGTPHVFINRDPRGYALKIAPASLGNRPLHRDWGGYGILAPEIGKDGE